MPSITSPKKQTPSGSCLPILVRHPTLKRLIHLFFATALTGSASAAIVFIPAPVCGSQLFSIYPERAIAYFTHNDIQGLHTSCGNMLANGSSVTVAQIEEGLAANADTIAGKTMVYHHDTDGVSDEKTDDSNHPNKVGNILYSSYSNQYLATYTEGVSPGIQNVHAFTTDAYRSLILDGTATFATYGIQLVNISNTMGSGGEEARIRKHDQMLADENVLAFHAHPASGPGTFSHTIWNGLVIGTAVADHSASGAATKYENVTVMGDEFKRQSPTMVSVDAGGGLTGVASSFVAPTVASGGAMLLDYAISTGKINATSNLVIKTILMSGATKELPGNPSYLWSQTSARPLDPQMGAGLYDTRNSYNIIQQPQGSADGSNQMHYGWDTSTTSDSQSREYYFNLTHSGRFISTLCWHRDVASDLLSFSLANLTMTLERWDSPTTSWLEVFKSDNAGENNEHVAQAVSAGRYRLRVESAESTNTTYGIAWRFDPYEPAILRTKVDNQLVSDVSPYQSTFVVPGNGKCKAVAVSGVYVASPGIGMTLERDTGGGTWEIVHSTPGAHSRSRWFNVTVTAGTYRITVTSVATEAHEFKFEYRVDPEIVSNIDNVALLQSLIPFSKNGNPVKIEEVTTNPKVSIQVPLYVYDHLNRFVLEQSSDLSTDWTATGVPTPSSTYDASTGSLKIDWEFDASSLPSRSFFRVNLGL